MPTLFWNDGEKKEFYWEDDDPVKIGKSKDCNVKLQDRPFVEDCNLEISCLDGSYIAKNLGKEAVSGKGGKQISSGESVLLRDNYLFVFGEAKNVNSRVLLVYKNENESAIELSEAIAVKIPSAINEYSTFISEFYCDLPEKNVGKYICDFFITHFPGIQTIIISNPVRKDGKESWMEKWRQMRDENDKYPASKTLAKDCLKHGVPRKLATKENNEASFSMVKNAARTAFCFPLKMEGKIYGLLYLDSNEKNGLGDTEYIKTVLLLDRGLQYVLYPYLTQITRSAQTVTIPQIKPQEKISKTVIDASFNPKDLSLYRKKGDSHFKEFCELKNEPIENGDMIVITTFPVDRLELSESIRTNKMDELISNYVIIHTKKE